MIFRQLIHDDLGCASYFVGDPRAGIAAVVDPQLDIEPYLELAEELDVRVEHVFETHNHADHISGHGRLVAATGAAIHISRLAAAAYPHQPFDDGDEWALGELRIRAWHTPGHRPEHTAFALHDLRRSSEPWALLTGDSLFVNDVARPDLAGDGEVGAREIFRSLRKLEGLPDTVEVWPGHLGGSLCGGADTDHKVCSTLGYERRNNALLAIDDEEEFVRRILAGLEAKPPNLVAIVASNTAPLVTRSRDLPALDPAAVHDRERQGALLVDVRPAEAFAAGHVPGSVTLQMRGAGFGTRLAWLAGADTEVVLVGETEGDGRDAAALAQAVGLRRLGGVLAGGIAAWRDQGRPLATLERMSAADLRERLAREPDLQVLDVRSPAERAAGSLPAATERTWHDVDAVPPPLDPARAIAVVCRSGRRAGTAASLLARHGAARPIHVVDGGVETVTCRSV